MLSSWHATPIRLHHSQTFRAERSIKEKNGVIAFLLITIDVWILPLDLMTSKQGAARIQWV
jgi:hypothetical protein